MRALPKILDVTLTFGIPGYFIVVGIMGQVTKAWEQILFGAMLWIALSANATYRSRIRHYQHAALGTALRQAMKNPPTIVIRKDDDSEWPVN